MFSNDGRMDRAASDGEIGRLDFFAAAKQHGALDGVLEFAHVARPRILHHLLHGGGREAGDLLAIAGAIAVRESAWPAAECLRAGRAAAGRWISTVLMRKSRSSRKLPAAASSCSCALVAERTRTSTRRVCEEPTRSSSPVSSTRSSLACWRMRDVGDFVEKERAAVGQFEAADAIGARVGECAFDVAEDFALEGAFRQVRRR